MPEPCIEFEGIHLIPSRSQEACPHREDQRSGYLPDADCCAIIAISKYRNYALDKVALSP
jgi:hypothetical protein